MGLLDRFLGVPGGKGLQHLRGGTVPVPQGMGDAGGARSSCLDCTRKHLGQAQVLLLEAQQGYPDHLWLAVGHLGEAADESVAAAPALAAKIRAARVALMGDPDASVDVLGLIRDATAAADAGGAVKPAAGLSGLRGSYALGALGADPPKVQVAGLRPISAPSADPDSFYKVEIPTGLKGTQATLEVMGQMAVEASKDPTFVQEIRGVVRECPGKDYACEYQAILSWVKDVTTYRHDGSVQEMQQSPQYILYVSGDGDCFTKGTKVLLRDGHRLVNIEALRVGDEIWGHDRWSKVTATAEKGILPTWKIVLNNGGTVRLTANHHVWRLRCPTHKGYCACLPSERIEERIPVSELRVKDVVLSPDRIPFGAESMDPGRAYIEGLYLSDGFKSHRTAFNISGRDGFPREEQKREVQAICERLGVSTRWGKQDIEIKDPEWTARMAASGTVAWEKSALSINYDESTAKQFLRGIMADSGFTTAGFGRAFSSSSEALWLQTRVLLKMFGVACGSAYLAANPKWSTSEHGMFRLGIRSTLSFLGKIYKKEWNARDVGIEKSKSDKTLRVKSITRDEIALPCFDITTDDHKVWLPEADWTTSQCNNLACLVAAADVADGAVGVRFRAIGTNDGNELSHVYTEVFVPGQGWLAQDPVMDSGRLGDCPPKSAWKMAPLDYYVIRP